MRRRSIASPLLGLLAAAAVLAGCGGSGGASSTSSSAAAGSDTAAGIPERGPIAPTRALTGRAADRVAGAPWPQFARDARRSGAADVVGPQTAHVRWRRQLEGPVVPGPAVGGGGVVYAASNGGILHAIDLASGRDRWTFDGGGGYGSDLSTVPALLEDGTIVWPGPLNTVFGLDPEGRLLWKVQLPGQPLSPAVAVDGTVVLGDMAGTLEALRPQGASEPELLWETSVGGISYGSPSIGPDGTVYTTADQSLFAVRNGQIAWSFEGRVISEVSPAVAPDGTVIFGTNGAEYGISPAGEELWKHSNGTRTYSSPVATRDGLVYYGDNHGRVRTLDAASGELIARVVGLERSAGVWTSPVVDSRHDVYFGAATGAVYGFDASGRRLFELETGDTVASYPALAADGTLLIGSSNGTLYAIG